MNLGGKKGMIHQMYCLRQKWLCKNAWGEASCSPLRGSMFKVGSMKEWRKQRGEEVRNKKDMGKSSPTQRNRWSDIAMVLEKSDFQLAVSTEMLVVTPTNPSFRASDGWAQRSKMHHNLVMQACTCTSMAQKLPGDHESKVEPFRNN